ncbi:MAG: RadC family protein [Clostridia bacterium]|nr:RadC family protein [Clostridia bacterium]
MEKQTQKKEYPHSGHRQRLIDKIESMTLCEHELLEGLLFNAIPRQNTNELAHKLLAEFGGMEEVLTATLPELEKVDGIGRSVAAYLRIVGLIAQRTFTGTAKKGMPKKFSYKTFMPYVKQAYEDVAFEVLDAYALDDTGEIIAKARFSSSMYGKVEVSAQNLLRLIYAQNPTGIVLVHNHPRGEATPSAKDDITTATCQKLCADNGVIFCDHIIYAQSGVYSYYLTGKIRKNIDGYEEGQRKWLEDFLRYAKE